MKIFKRKIGIGLILFKMYSNIDIRTSILDIIFNIVSFQI